MTTDRREQVARIIANAVNDALAAAGLRNVRVWAEAEPVRGHADAIEALYATGLQGVQSKENGSASQNPDPVEPRGSPPANDRFVIAVYSLRHLGTRQKTNLLTHSRVLIESDNGFWRADRCGYTAFEGAAVYTGADAYDATHHCGPEKAVRYFLLSSRAPPISPSDEGEETALVSTNANAPSASTSSSEELRASVASSANCVAPQRQSIPEAEGH